MPDDRPEAPVTGSEETNSELVAPEGEDAAIDPASPESPSSPPPPQAPAVLVGVDVVTSDSAALIQQPAESAAKGMSDLDRQDFERLHSIVRKAAATFVDIGTALEEIRKRELWRLGGHATWNAYCDAIEGMTRRNANLLIATADAVKTMSEVGNVFPASSGITPHAVTQVIPLLKIKNTDLRRQA